jgi:hypothetical protein
MVPKAHALTDAVDARRPIRESPARNHARTTSPPPLLAFQAQSTSIASPNEKNR